MTILKWENLIIAMNANHQTKTDILLFLFRKATKLVKNQDHYVVLDVGGERFTAKRDTDHYSYSYCVVNRFGSF